MAFNFNWSPLIADTSRAREMLTNALNKSPKPPIIVDDIIVTELNLGSTPPSLEILEVGDLAEDRFRGIFKMVYSGDAFLTLKTRVQANPLNTYLSTKPSFASPQPLAAASSLTIPLAITLSDIKLSGFVILVFSKQKGITLVFRNDPLESLKVSSTFDSIPFVRDYLQKEIEKQLRTLFIEDLPAIIHRLSLRLFVAPDHQQASAEVNSNTHLDNDPEDQRKTVDPLSSPPQGPSDGLAEDDLNRNRISLDDTSYASYHFSRKNLLRLAALNDSHRTLSLFTPQIRDTVYRAWAGAVEHGRGRHAGPLLVPSRPSGLTLASLKSYTGSATRGDKAGSTPASLHSFSSDSYAATSTPGSTPQSSTSSRPTLTSTAYTTSNTYTMGGTLTSGAPRPRTRKRKHRIVNLRKNNAEPRSADTPTEQHAANLNDNLSRPTTPTSSAPPASSSWATMSTREDDELVTPPDSPERNQDISHAPSLQTPKPSKPPQTEHDGTETIKPLRRTNITLQSPVNNFTMSAQSTLSHQPHATVSARPSGEKQPLSVSDLLPPPDSKHSAAPTTTGPSYPFAFPNYGESAQPGGILEKAWLMKMASEIARKAESERKKHGEDFWNGKFDPEQLHSSSSASAAPPPPPPYAA